MSTARRFPSTRRDARFPASGKASIAVLGVAPGDDPAAVVDVRAQAAPVCPDGSLTWYSAIGRYPFVGATRVSINGMVHCGFVYALSDDCIQWSEPGLITESPAPFPPCANGPNIGREYYPAVIDHADTTITFERSGSTFHIYHLRYNNDVLDRDLLRVPVSLTNR